MAVRSGPTRYAFTSKQGHTFYEDDFVQWIYYPAAEYAAPFINRYEGNQYWNEVRRICTDPKARRHSKRNCRPHQTRRAPRPNRPWKYLIKR
jgi:hypothetical protein